MKVQLKRYYCYCIFMKCFQHRFSMYLPYCILKTKSYYDPNMLSLSIDTFFFTNAQNKVIVLLMFSFFQFICSMCNPISRVNKHFRQNKSCTFYFFFGKPRRKKHCVDWMFCSQIVWEIMVLVRLLDLSPVKTVTEAVNANRLQSFPDKQAVNFVSMHSLQESEISSRMQVALTVYLSVVVSGNCNGTVGFPSLT